MLTNEHEEIDIPTAPAHIVETDLFLHEPSKADKIEMRKSTKKPSEWLSLLCGSWVEQNPGIVSQVDTKFLQYKSYLRGQLSPQLLCRLSIPQESGGQIDKSTQMQLDFWEILGVADEFDRSYIISQVERFCSLWNIRGTQNDDDHIQHLSTSSTTGSELLSPSVSVAVPPLDAMPIAEGVVPTNQSLLHHSFSSPTHTIGSPEMISQASLPGTVGDQAKKHLAEVTTAHKKVKDAERALGVEIRKVGTRKEQKRLSEERREMKAREREANSLRKAAREATREERRRKKLELRVQRERFAQEQKQAALQRAAELVASNRVPIEITRGAAAAQAAAAAAVAASGMVSQIPQQSKDEKKTRSRIVVSTANDLHQIVTHSKNLWAKYNAIAKEHNQKVNWITVAKELGIHVKVREKYARMHARAEARGFDFATCGHYKIKDYGHIFLEPLMSNDAAKKNAAMAAKENEVMQATENQPHHHHHHHQHLLHHHHPSTGHENNNHLQQNHGILSDTDHQTQDHHHSEIEKAAAAAAAAALEQHKHAEQQMPSVHPNATEEDHHQSEIEKAAAVAVVASQQQQQQQVTNADVGLDSTGPPDLGMVSDKMEEQQVWVGL